MRNTVDVMIDLETVGKMAGCGILSIGACTFDIRSVFNESISQISCLNAGLVEDPETLSWWSKQPREVYLTAFSGEVSIIKVLGDFSDWLRTLGYPKDKVYVWGNGAKFDLGILEAAYAAVGMDYPIDYKNERCYRTLKNLYYDIKAEKFEGQKHNALHDAIHQARHASAILKKHFSVIKAL